MASTCLSESGSFCCSKPLLLLFVTVLLQGPLCAHCSPILSPHQRHRPDPGLSDGHGGVVEVPETEEDGTMNLQLLDSLKEQFLRTFNLSGSGPLSAGGTREEPPEYMMELYNRFANDRNAMPSANIIRSFKNEDPSPSVIDAGGARRHKLLFNVSVPHHERVTAAELRLYTLVQIDRHLYAGVDRKVTIYELETTEEAANATEEEEIQDGEERAGHDTEQIHLTELASRQVFGTDNGWESFDLTDAVQRWRNSEQGTTHQLEVHIASVVSEEDIHHEMANESDDSISQDMKIDMSPEEKHKPLLIVFSNDQSSDHREDKRELSEMIDHETSDMVLQNEIWNDLEKSKDLYEDEAEPDEEDLIQMRSNFIYDTASRIRRNAKGNHCKKQSLYVEFKDIGWDSWILAPTGYEAYECAGVCTFPLTKHVTPTKHAIVQTLVNINSPQKASRACCVPTKLDPISLLYLDDTGVVTYKYKYEGMVVAECGCR